MILKLKYRVEDCSDSTQNTLIFQSPTTFIHPAEKLMSKAW